jgi:hypothetical protein
MSRDAELQTVIRDYAEGRSTHDEFTQSLGRLYPLAEKAIPKTPSGIKELADVTVALIKAATEKYQARVKKARGSPALSRGGPRASPR